MSNLDYWQAGTCILVTVPVMQVHCFELNVRAIQSRCKTERTCTEEYIAGADVFGFDAMNSAVDTKSCCILLRS